MAFDFNKIKEENTPGTKENLEKLAGELANMNYGNFTESEDYASLAKRYSQYGQKAMDDTIGKVAARTGGLASSYATAAGNQAYNDYMSKLEDAARSAYDSQRQEKLDDLGVSQSLYQQNYQEKRDGVADYQWKQQFDASNSQWDEQFKYTKDKDEKTALSNELYYNPDAYGSYEAYKSANPDSKLTEAQYNQILNTAKGAYREDNKAAEENNKAAEEEKLWNYAMALWSTGKHIDEKTMEKLGITAEMEDTYASYYNGQNNNVTLDADLETITQQLENGNFSTAALNTYEKLTGQSYAEHILRNRMFYGLSEADIYALGSYMQTRGEAGEKIADLLYDQWRYYYGISYGPDANNPHNIIDNSFASRTFTFVDPNDKNIDFNSGSIVRDNKGYEYSVAELFQILMKKYSYKEAKQLLNNIIKKK